MALLALEKAPFFAIFSTTRNSASTLAAGGAGTGFVVGQAFQPDIPNVRLESLTYKERQAGKPDLLKRDDEHHV